jgi:hypothetical protein
LVPFPFDKGKGIILIRRGYAPSNFPIVYCIKLRGYFLSEHPLIREGEIILKRGAAPLKLPFSGKEPFSGC